MMEFKTPWWDKYRKQKYNPRSLTLEMIIRHSFVQTFKEYIDVCSISGVKQICHPDHCLMLRLIWIGVFCMALGTVIYFLQYIWMSILTKPLVVTDESFTYPIKEIAFPAVALCNINRISRKALRAITLETYPKLAKYNITLTNLEYFYLDMGRLLDFEYDGTRPYIKLLEALSFKEFSDHTTDLMKELAPSCDEMLIKCQWAGEEVDCKSIFQVRRTVFGHCCAFNYVLDYESADNPSSTIAPIKSQIVPGVNNGLRVIIDAMLDDYAYPMGKRTGFEVLLFDPIHYADMTGGRVLQRMVQPNQAEFFQISSTKQIASPEVRKYPLKARKCLFRDEKVKEYYNMYSYSACLVKCRIQSVQSLCKCTPYFLPTGSATHVETCTLKNLRCLNKYKEKLQYLYPIETDDTVGLEQELADSLYCPNCWPDCELTQHSTKSYKTTLPGPNENKGFENGFTKGVNLTDKSIISIYHSTTGGILHRLDVVAYWFEILSNIGGFAGMLMGIGIYTIVELTYFLFIRFVTLIYFNYVKYN